MSVKTRTLHPGRTEWRIPVATAIPNFVLHFQGFIMTINASFRFLASGQSHRI